LGCWQSTNIAAQRTVGNAKTATVCVTPAAGTSAVDITTVVDGKTVEHTHIDANGQKIANSKDGCTGFESAKWSATAIRVYVQSEYTCAGGTKRSSNGVMSMSPEGQWLDVLSVGSGLAAGVRVTRMHETRSVGDLPDDVAEAVRTGALSRSAALMMASTDLHVSDILDVTKNTSPAVVEAWLVERGQKLEVNAKTLVQLADAGLPGRVIDIIVALAYPRNFALRPATVAGGGSQPGIASGTRYGAPRSAMGYDPYGYSMYGYDGYDDCLSPYSLTSPYSPFVTGCGNYGYSQYGYSQYGYGYGGYGYGWYPGSQPVIIYTKSPDGSTGANGTPHPRVVNGKGYTQGGSSSSSGQQSGGASTTTSPAPASGGSGDASVTRTAKPRPPGI
jgi:hypothetical protein